MPAFRPFPLLIVGPLLIAGPLAGCAEGPFVDIPISQTVEKPADPVIESGTVSVCHNDSNSWDEIEALARESCAKYGYEPTLATKTRWDCRMTAPHRAVFTCSLPGMVDEAGRPINPANKAAVEAWRKRTGKPPPKPVRTGPGAPAASTSPAPAPAAAGPTPGAQDAAPLAQPPAPAPAARRPLTPADIAGKPAFLDTAGKPAFTDTAGKPAFTDTAGKPAFTDTAGKPAFTDTAGKPVLAPAPPPLAPPNVGGFTLDSGSWGQHFEE